MRAVNCPTCDQPLTEVGVLDGLLDETADHRALLFAERAIELGLPRDSRWQILECQHEDCGCHCRRYDRLQGGAQ